LCIKLVKYWDKYVPVFHNVLWRFYSLRLQRYEVYHFMKSLVKASLSFVCRYIYIYIYIYIKVKWSRYRSGVAQRVNRGIALLFHDRGTRRGWVVSSTPRPHCTPGKTRYPFYRRLGGPQGRSGWAENLVPTGIWPRTVQAVVSRYPDCATRPIYIYICVCVCVCVTMFTLFLITKKRKKNIYVSYSESKHRLRIFLAHPQDCHFAHVQWLPLSIEKPRTPFREIRIIFMFILVR